MVKVFSRHADDLGLIPHMGQFVKPISGVPWYFWNVAKSGLKPNSLNHWFVWSSIYNFSDCGVKSIR